MKWLRRVWAWMTWEPTWPAPMAPVRAYQPLLDCLGIMDDDEPILR